MTLKDLGSIIKEIRETELDMTQSELAKALKTNQNMISRFEKGKGATIELQLKIMDYLKKKNLKSYMIFYEPFDIKNLHSTDSMNIEQIIQFIERMQAENAQDVTMLKVLIKSLA